MSRAAALMVVIAAALAPRVALLNQSLWSDEVFSLALATGHSLEHPADIADPGSGDYVEFPLQRTAAELQRYLALDEPRAGLARVVRATELSDTNPPLYYLLLHLWLRAFGATDRALRAFSIVAALAAMPLLAWLALRIGGNAAVIPVLVLFAAAPVSIYYSVEGRAYALLWFLASAFIALTIVVSAAPTPSRWIAWALTASAGLFTHYFFFFVWVACVGWLALEGRLNEQPRPVLARGAAAIVLSAFLVAPWYAFMPERLHRWRVTWDWLNGPTSRRDVVLRPLSLAWHLVSGSGNWYQSAFARWIVTITIASLAIAFISKVRYRVFSPRRAILWACIAATACGPMVFDVLRTTQTAAVPRYALAGLPAALLILAAALARMRLPLRALLMGLLLAAWASSDVAILQTSSRMSEPFATIGRRLSASTTRDDIIVVHSIPSGVLGLARYLRPDAVVVSWVSQLHQRRVPEDVEQLSSGRPRLVLVRIHPFDTSAPEEQWLRQHAQLVAHEKYGQGDLLYFVPRDGSRFAWR